MALGKLNLKLGIDVSDLDKELGKVERSMSRFGGKMQNIGTTLTQSLTLPIIGLGAASLKSFADIEKLQNGLIAIMGSSTDAAVEMERLRKVAENPGLALPEVVTASASLQSVGMNADAARETITQFGNAVARAGKGPEVFDGVITALGQISAVGQITQEDLNQIKERLPEFAKVMKQEFGVVTAEALRDAGISSEKFIQRSVGALGNLERANGGLANTFDNLKDNVGASLAELGKSINETLNLESVVSTLSAGLQRLVDGFKSLNPETQGFIVKAGLLVAALGPAIFIVGKLITTFGALIGTTRLIMTTVKNLSTVITGAFAKILANPAILGVTLAIAAVGAIALYVYDNWQAFSDRFKNIWINIKNSVMQGVTFVLGKLDSLQKALGLDLFDLSGMTKYQEEQRIVAAEFKTIGETVDSLKGKFKSLFMAAPGKGGGGGGTEGTGELVFGDGGAPTGGATGGGVRALMPSTNLLPSLNLLPTQLDSATASTQRLKSEQEALNQATTKVNSNFKEQLTQIELLKLSFDQLNTGLKNIIEGTLQDMAVAFGETLGQSLAGASFDIRSVIGPLADALIQFGKLAVQVGIAALGIKAALKSLNPAIAIAGGVALIALGTFVKSKLAAPALAQGGLATGPTMALVGDNRNARVDPEVIAPLSKLKSMMGDMGVGGTLETRISGNDLIILLNRSQKGLNRVQ
uniref:tape measure protein n=1 Tax=Yoonia sp. TaxID=2212373 RepID=UPI004048CC14